MDLSGLPMTSFPGQIPAPANAPETLLPSRPKPPAIPGKNAILNMTKRTQSHFRTLTSKSHAPAHLAPHSPRPVRPIPAPVRTQFPPPAPIHRLHPDLS